MLFQEIQVHLDELSFLLLKADTPDKNGELPSFHFDYTMRDYANLSTILLCVLSVAYTKKLWEISNGKVDPNEYAKSDDIMRRIESIEAPFLYHLGKTPKEIIQIAYCDNSL